MKLPRARIAGAVRVERMRPRHLDDVVAIERQVYPRPWSTALFRNELARREDRCYLVAHRDGRVAGYAGVLVAVGEAHVLTVAVDPSARRAGIATRLVAELLAVAVERGAAAATLEVRESNQAAEALYRRFGFESAGIRPGYYEDNGEGAHIMWLHELAAPATHARIAGEASRVGHPVPRALTATA